MPSQCTAAIACRTNNVGDDIQMLAALQYLSDDVVFIDRERMNRASVPAGTKLIMNGWFMHETSGWPPPPEIDPLIVSFHASRRRFEDGSALEYLREQSRRRPIGARDLDTLDMLTDAGIEAYWSGCLTLTLRLEKPCPRADDIVAVDLNAEDVALLSRRTERPIREATHFFTRPCRGIRGWLPSLRRRMIGRRQRIETAKARLHEYASAAAVVTGRLHVALPCLAFGTPVLFVVDEPDDPRLRSWLGFFHWCSRDTFRAGAFAFDFADPPQNDDGWRAVSRSLTRTCQEFTGIPPRPFQAAG